MRWIVLSALLAAACQSGGQQTWLPKLQADKPLSGPPAQMMEALSPLQFSGTILILSGAGLLFVSRGSKGWIPIGLGVGLVALMAFLATVLASQVMVYALVAGLILAVVIAVFNFKEIRKWIKS
jgi:hypothetical protein